MFLSSAASIGYAHSKKEVITIVETVLSSKGKTKSVSSGWWESFVKRHSQLCIRKAEKVTYARLQATDPLVLNSYFDILEKTLEEYDLFEDPSRVFNCDEAGISYQHSPPSVVAVKGQHHPRVVTGSKRHVTVLACANASGYYLPPLGVMKRKALVKFQALYILLVIAVGLTVIHLTTGFQIIFWFMLHQLDLSYCLTVTSLTIIQFLLLKQHMNKSLFCFPPSTTHLTQPLDKGIFGPLKRFWNEECHAFYRKNPGEVLTDCFQ